MMKKPDADKFPIRPADLLAVNDIIKPWQVRCHCGFLHSEHKTDAEATGAALSANELAVADLKSEAQYTVVELHHPNP